MPEITDYRITGLKTSIHSLRLRIANKKLKNNKLDEKRSISKNDNGLITLLPGECAINQGEKGNSAFLIISGSFNVEINNKVVGGMSSGEIFGELSLILGENRKATVRAITGSELVEIDSSFLKEYFISSQGSSNKKNESVLEAQRIIKDLSVELGKQKDQSINVTREQLIEAVKDESHVIQSLAIQLHKRLSQMITKEKKSQL